MSSRSHAEISSSLLNSSIATFSDSRLTRPFSPGPSIHVYGSLRQSRRDPPFPDSVPSLSPLPFSNGPIRLRRYPFLVYLVSLVCLYAEIETLQNAILQPRDIIDPSSWLCARTALSCPRLLLSDTGRSTWLLWLLQFGFQPVVCPALYRLRLTFSRNQSWRTISR